MNINYIKYSLFKPFKSWKNKYLKSLSKKEARINNLYDRVATEIGEYTKESKEAVKQKFNLGPQSEKSFTIFNDQRNISNEAVKDFYRGAGFYIYELPLWNAQSNRPGNLRRIILPYLRRNKYKKLLDFGAGTGDLCIELAKNGLDVTYCDIAGKSSDFAKRRFEKRGLRIKMVNDLSLADKDYDCIVSFDVFEHVSNLPEAIEKIKSYLRPEGSIIFSGAFSGGALHLEENEVYNEFKNLDKMMRGKEFYFIDKFAQYYFYKIHNSR